MIKIFIYILGTVFLTGAGVGVYMYMHSEPEVTQSMQSSQTQDTTSTAPTPTPIDTEGTTPVVPKTETPVVVTPTQKTVVDVTTLPLGDGKRSTSPKQGYVFSCQTNFSANAGGASHDGDWIHGTTWNLLEKISVQGIVSWPQAQFTTNYSGLVRSLTGNGLPVGSNTGTFPIAVSDPAYQIDRNPNTITAQTVEVDIPSNPTFASNASCVPMGVIGRALNGVAIFNALDGRGDDAVAHEVQDSCSGHPERTGEYHYHGPSDCMPGADAPNTLVGYALDGFGIYSRFDAKGNEYTNVDLDECHGLISEIDWNGETVNMYHYVLTDEYPYTLGCFRGTPVVNTQTDTAVHASAPNKTGGTQTANEPPAEAVSACANKSANSSCTISTPNGSITGTCQTPPNQSKLACVPGR